MTDAPATTDLCGACGLCCTGWIDPDVRVSDDDIARLPTYVPIRPHPFGRVMALPCLCHGGTSCRIYDQRPAACHEFKCLTLVAWHRGDIAIDEAQQRLAAATGATAALDAILRETGWAHPGEPGPDAWRRFVAAMRGASDAEAFRRRYAGILLTIAAYERIANRVLVPRLIVDD